MRYKTRPEIRRPRLGIASILRQKQVAEMFTDSSTEIREGQEGQRLLVLVGAGTIVGRQGLLAGFKICGCKLTSRFSIYTNHERSFLILWNPLVGLMSSNSSFPLFICMQYIVSCSESPLDFQTAQKNHTFNCKCNTFFF